MTSNKKVSYSRHSLIENYSQKKLVYLYSKEQHEDPEQQKLFMTALECSSKCMYPDYLSIDSDYGTVSRIYKESGMITSPMGNKTYSHLEISYLLPNKFKSIENEL